MASTESNWRFSEGNPDAWIFTLGENIGIVKIISLGSEYGKEVYHQDGFEVIYRPSSERYNEHIFGMFGIKASGGVVRRKCPECGVYNLLNGKTFDSYCEYTAMRTAFKANGPKALFGCRFFFDCDHPIDPKPVVPAGMKVEVIDLFAVKKE